MRFLAILFLVACSSTALEAPPDAQPLGSCADVCPGGELAPVPALENGPERICLLDGARCVLFGEELPVMQVPELHYQSDFMVSARSDSWTICAHPAESVALWARESRRMTMVAQSETGCINQDSPVFLHAPLRAGLAYSVVVIGSERPLLVIDHG